MHGRRVVVLVAFALAILTVGIIPLTTPASAAGDPCGPDSNPIVCENSKPGTSPDIWDINGAGDPSIQGFATSISVNVGETEGFKIDTDASSYSITIYRTGYYQGLGAREIATVQPSATLPQTQPECLTDPTTEIYDCGNWGLSASWQVPSDAVSGVYIALLHRNDTGGESQIIFDVRNDASHSQIVFQTSDTTWEAYNTYGGSDFYQGAANGRAYKLSYNRPIITRGANDGRDYYFSAEFAMVQFLEENGYDVSYISGLDTDIRGNLLTNHKVFLSVGHDEYWSYNQRAEVEKARDAGVNLMFLSGNEVYWRGRWEGSEAGPDTPDRTFVSYKETWSNAKIDPSPEWTGTWRDPRFAPKSEGGGLPENGLTGTIYMSNFSDLPITVTAQEGKYRLWRNTDLTSLPAGTSQALAPHTIGYESDEDLDNGARPAGLVDLSTTTGAVPQYMQDFGNTVAPGTTTHHVTLYRAPSGALVFGAGTVQWTWGLTQNHDGDGAPPDVRMQQATVNMLADMSAQPQTLASNLVAATKSTDTTAPSTTITSPKDGAAIPNGTSVTVTGTATDGGGGQVAGIEVSTDGGTTWHPASGTGTWSYTYSQAGDGAATIEARATDDSGNIGAPATVTLDASCPCSVFGSTVPDQPATDDSGAVELGLQFTPDADGYATGVRFYKGAGNTGTHVGSLWSASGQRLASVTFTNETATGWQTAEFTSAVPLSKGQTYIVSYTAPNGHYAARPLQFYVSGIDAPPLQVAGGYGAAPAGVYGSPGTFPSNSYDATDYYVDVVFDTVDTTPLTASGFTPLADSSSVSPTAVISATMSKDVVATSAAIDVADSDGDAVAGSSSYDQSTHVVTFTPTKPLTNSTKYTATVVAQDAQGKGISSTSSWSFTTADPDQVDGKCPCSLFNDSTTPDVLDAADPNAVTLGVRFASTTDGTVTGVRFYKGPGNTGTHVGALWTADGTMLASATFENETSSGWQIVNFDEPVSITKDTTYVASYRTTVGEYSTIPGAFAAGSISRGPLHADAGMFNYSDGSPVNASSTNYLVDVVFKKAAAPLTMISTTPASGAVGISTGADPSVTFSTAIQNGATFEVSTGGGDVDGTTALSTDGTTLTFSPTNPLSPGTTYTVNVTGATSTQGTTTGTITWSFTTARASAGDCPCSLLGPAVPGQLSADDSSGIELGMAFSPSADGEVTGVRFYKGPGNTGTHTGALWDGSGNQLAAATFTNETDEGWQQVQFDKPVPVTAGDTYVVSYVAPNGHYSYTSDYFDDPVTVGPLTARNTRNGLYSYGGGFPTSAWNHTNYFVDVVFTKSAAPLNVTDESPGPGFMAVPTGSTISATYSRAIQPGAQVKVTASGQQIAGSTALSADGTKLTFTPSASLATQTQYTVTVSGASTSDGVTADDATWGFTTAGSTANDCPCALLGSTVPDQPSADDSAAIELGMAFTPSEQGEVTGIRFYKGAGNTGAHSGSLWDTSGNLLGTVEFTGESSSGWQSAMFTQPVAVNADTTYIVSYLAPNGHYSYTSSFFDEPLSVGPLTAPSANNGRYTYGGGFPTSSWNGTNYFVDVIFAASSQ